MNRVTPNIAVGSVNAIRIRLESRRVDERPRIRVGRSHVRQKVDGERGCMEAPEQGQPDGFSIRADEETK